MTNDDIKRVVEEAAHTIHVEYGCNEFEVSTIIEKSLLQVAPKPLPEIGKNELGKMLYELGAQALTFRQPAVGWHNLSEVDRLVYIETATTFTASLATSLRRNEGACELIPCLGGDGHFFGCDPSETFYEPMKSKLKACPFCGKPITTNERA